MKHQRLDQVIPEKPPLVVDLDGTLIRGDLFVEGILRFVMAAPTNAFRLASLLLAGRAQAKAEVARQTPCTPETLPYDERVVEWLRAERETGRRIVLATASDQAEARAVADFLDVFDDVVASDGVTNLKSKRKAERLREMFPQGFVYAGNELADLPVWATATAAVVANASPSLEKAVARKHETERTFPARGGFLRALIKAIRPQQWAKNGLVFVPLIAGHGWFDMAAWRDAFIAFMALSATASSVYLVNDAADIDADRRHHRKRNRPFASGRLSPVVGLATSLLLLVTGLTLAHMASVLWLVLTYLVVSSSYTFYLKRKMLVDVFVLAGLYMIRVLIGGAAASSTTGNYMASSWLLAFSCFFFLSLALVKRFTEVATVAANGGNEIARRGYRGSDGYMLGAMGIASGFISSLVLALYLQSDIVARNYSEPFLLWVLPAAMVYWQCRTWLLAQRGDVHDDPLIFAMRDRVSWIIGAIVAAAFVAAMLTPPGLIPGAA